MTEARIHDALLMHFRRALTHFASFLISRKRANNLRKFFTSSIFLETWGRCTSEPHQRPKEEIATPESMSWIVVIAGSLFSTVEGCRSSHLSAEFQEKEKPATGASSLTQWQSTGWEIGRGRLFYLTYTNYENRLSQRSGRRFEFLPRQVFPQGLMPPCRADMSNTLALNCPCEVCCGMHRSCKTCLLNLTGMEQWGDSRKIEKSLLSYPNCRYRTNTVTNWSARRFLAEPLPVSELK